MRRAFQRMRETLHEYTCELLLECTHILRASLQLFNCRMLAEWEPQDGNGKWFSRICEMTGIENELFCGGEIPCLMRKDDIEIPKDDQGIDDDFFDFLLNNSRPDNKGAC